VVGADRQVPGDLRRRAPDGADSPHDRAQAAGPHAGALRPQPRRALRLDPADGRHRQAALQGAVAPDQRGPLYALAPALSILTAVAALAIIPFGGVQDIFGTDIGLYGIDVGIGPLYLFAFGAVAFYGLVLGGWASGSKYSFLGAMRAAAQLISYEVAMGLSLIGVIFTAGTLSLVGIVEAQQGMWFVVPQFAGFLIFLIAGFAETNRTPFDLPEADAELVQGYMTEYGAGRFALYYFAEYMNMIVISAIATTLFLGGWLLPFGIDPPGWVDPFVVLAKIFFFLFLFIWVRGTLPRLRYDQLMSFGWKVLLPLATVNALVTAIVVVVR
jgi:NADH-quinone oxidoreductase subunit H